MSFSLMPIIAAMISLSTALPQIQYHAAEPHVYSLVSELQDVQPDITIQTEYTYTGSLITPEYTITDGEITLTEGVDFLVQTDKEIIDVGEYTLTFTYIGGRSGTVTKTVNVIPMDISEAGFHIEINDPLNIYYNNSPARPQLTVKTPDGTELPAENYSVSYSNNNEPGQALATVTARGNYTGSLTENFIIRPAPSADITVKKTGSDYITLSWSASPGASGYEIYKKYDGKWNKTAEANADELSKKLSKRRANTEYGFYVLAYKEIDGERYYSPQSETVYAYTNAAKPAKVTLGKTDVDTDKAVPVGSRRVRLSANQKVLILSKDLKRIPPINSRSERIPKGKTVLLSGAIIAARSALQQIPPTSFTISKKLQAHMILLLKNVRLLIRVHTIRDIMTKNIPIMLS